MWVMPSSSARCAQLPRAADKVPFYAALKKFRDYLNGMVSQIDESELVFSEPRVKSCYEAEPKTDPFGEGMTDVMKTEDGVPIPCKKKRGRPKKIKLENGEEPPAKTPTPRKTPAQTSANANCDFPKKKRGRPKKVKVEDSIAQMDGVGVPSATTVVPGSESQGMGLSKCFSSPSPIQSPNSFYHMTPALTPPNSSSNLYPPQHPPSSYCQSPRPAYNTASPRPAPPFSQSPRPHSQPFTHSDLSSEISAAISSEQLGSPASPSLGPPDFDPPTSMTEEAECRLGSGGSPAPSTHSGDHSQHQQHHYHGQHQQYHPYPHAGGGGGVDSSQQPPPQSQHNGQQQQHYPSPRQPQDMARKSLSGLESLVDQIPSITEGEPPPLGVVGSEHVGGEYGAQFSGYHRSAVSPAAAYNYSSTPAPASAYPLYPTPTWSAPPYEPVPLVGGYPQLPSAYAQSAYAAHHHAAAAGLHVPSPNYPYYGYPQPAHPPPGYPPYLGGF